MTVDLKQMRKNPNFFEWENWAKEQLELVGVNYNTIQTAETVIFQIFDFEKDSPIVEGVLNKGDGTIEYTAPKDKGLCLGHLVGYGFIHCHATAIFNIDKGYDPKSEFEFIEQKAREQFAGYN